MLSARQGGRRLSQLDVTQTDIAQCLNLACNLRDIFKKDRRFLCGHLQHIADVFILIFYLQCFPIVAFALANLARDIDVRQKVHLNLQNAVALRQASHLPPLTLKENLPLS